MKRALIHYFSGTGNTYHMAQVIGDRLKQQGYDVSQYCIGGRMQEPPKDIDLHVFAYPIYAYGTPSMVIKYIRGLKPVEGSKAAVICTCGGFEGQSLVHASAILKRKGFDVFYTNMVIYPDNWTQVLSPPAEDIQKKIFEAADEKAAEFADKVGRLETSIRKCSIFNLAWSWVVLVLFSFVGRRILGKVLIADRTCTSCGLCEKKCPVGAIKLKHGKPRWNWGCENCQRCINLCPARSIHTSVFKLVAYFLLAVALVFIVKGINQYIKLHTLVDILLYSILFIVTHLFVDIIFNALERIPAVKKLFEYSYAKGYRRYFVDEFKL